jgi:peptidyl-prolyl cis-trans isomerase B (cyclophilin B)
MKREHKLTTSILLLTLLLGIFVTGCQGLNDNDSAETTNNNSSEETQLVNQNITADNSSLRMNLPKLEGKATVVLTVNGSPITIEVDGNNAPITAGNFLDLVNRGVYDGLVFHRVVKEPQPFVVQGGDPQGKNPNFPVGRLGTGGFIDPETQNQRYIPLEIRPEYDEDQTDVPAIVYSQTTKETPALKHSRGAIAMARSQMPDSASSQFYFALADLPFLDGNYAVFGYVTEGMDVVDKIKQGDRISSAKVVSGIENLKN